MKTFFKSGSWNALCDVCGFTYKAEELMKRWDGLMVCEQDWEARHPQDLIRIPKDDPSVPWARPIPEDVFITFNLLTESGLALVTESGDNLIYTYDPTNV